MSLTKRIRQANLSTMQTKSGRKDKNSNQLISNGYKNFPSQLKRNVNLNNLDLAYHNFKIPLYPVPKPDATGKQVFKCKTNDDPLFLVNYKKMQLYGQLPKKCPRPHAKWIKWIGVLPLEKIVHSLNNECPSQRPSLDVTMNDGSVLSRRDRSLPFVASIYLPMVVSNMTFKALIDTGASLSTVSQCVLARLDSRNVHKVRECEPIQVSLAIKGSQTYHVRKIVDLRININSRIYLWPFYVIENSANDFVLGLDWMRAYNVQLSLEKASFSLKIDGHVWCDHKSEELSSKAITTNVQSKINSPTLKRLVRLKNSVFVPPNTIARVQVKSNEVIDSDLLLVPFENSVNLKSLTIASSIFKVSGGVGETYITNSTSVPIKLKSGSVLGSYEIIEPFSILSQVRDENVPLNECQVKLGSAQASISQIDPLIRTLKINSNLSEVRKNELLHLLSKYRKTFAFSKSELGCANNAEHVIETLTETPVKSRPYRVSYYERVQISDLVQQMLDDGIIVPSISPYSSPVVLVKKADGSPRFCVDYRKLNAITKVNSYPLPRMDDLFDRLNGIKYMSKLDLMMGFHQVPLSTESKEKSAFVTPDGHYEYERMSFGLNNAPATFQQLMDRTLKNLKWSEALVYLDDTLALGKDWESHMKSLELVLEAVTEANLTLQPAKCEFGMEEIEFLGHEISSQGIKVKSKKVDAVKNFPIPNSVTKVRSFVSLCSFYRKFIPYFSKIARPLYDLMKDKVKFEWTASQQKSFDELKDRLINAPILSHFDPNAPTEIHTDASRLGLGAILMQWQNCDGRLVRKTIAYASRTLNNAEVNYHVTELECLAVVYAIEIFRPYVYGQQFKVVTDHCSLCHLINLKDPNGRLARWALRLQPYRFVVQYNSGKLHSHVDALSRNPVDVAPEEEIGFENRYLFSTQINVEPLLANLLNEQRLDSNFKVIIDSLLSCIDKGEAKPKKYEEYELFDGILHKANFDPDCKLWNVCVPKSLRLKVLNSAHDDAGHFGLFKTWHFIRSRYFWPNYYQHVRKFVLSCQVCQFFTRNNSAKVGPLLPIDPPDHNFRRIGIDFIGPLPLSHLNNQFVLVMVDHLSRYVEVKAVPKQTSVYAILAIQEMIIFRHGYPSEILCDQGKQFVSSSFRDFCSNSNIKLSLTSVYSPSTNGLCEKVNDSLKRILAKKVGSNHNDWERKLQESVFNYNSSVHHVTKCSPFYSVFTRQPTLKCDLELGQNSNDYLDSASKRANRVRTEVRKRTQRFQEHQKDEFDANHPVSNFKVGDFVLHANFERVVGQVSKFLVKWKGPFIIVRKLGPLTFEICKQVANRLPQIVQVHARNLKLYRFPYEISRGSNVPPSLSCYGSEQIQSSHGHSRRMELSSDEEDGQPPVAPPMPEADDADLFSSCEEFPHAEEAEELEIVNDSEIRNDPEIANDPEIDSGSVGPRRSTRSRRAPNFFDPCQ